MTELTISQIIKIIIILFVIVIVIAGVYLAFKTYVIPYFQGLGNFSTSKLIFGMLT